MPRVTTANLWSEDFYRQLVIPALNEDSILLRRLRRRRPGAGPALPSGHEDPIRPGH